MNKLLPLYYSKNSSTDIIVGQKSKIRNKLFELITCELSIFTKRKYHKKIEV